MKRGEKRKRDKKRKTDWSNVREKSELKIGGEGGRSYRGMEEEGKAGMKWKEWGGGGIDVDGGGKGRRKN